MAKEKKQQEDDEAPASAATDTTETGGGAIDDTDEVIEEYISAAREIGAIPTMYLYKYSAQTGTNYEAAGFFRGDEIPNTDTIGKRLGSGRFFCTLRYVKGGKQYQTTKHFRLHTIYDELKKEIDDEKRRQQAAQFPGTIPAPAAAPTTQETFSIVKDILSLLLPMIKAQQPPQIAATPRPDTAAELMGAYGMMQKVLKNNLFDTAATYKQLAAKFADTEYQDPDGIDEEGKNKPEEKGIMEKIIDMIEPFFSLIAQKGMAGKIAAATVKAAPAFNEVLKDQNLCRMIIQYFDRTKGRALADIALSNIGINRTQFFPAAAAAVRLPTKTTTKAPGAKKTNAKA